MNKKSKNSIPRGFVITLLIFVVAVTVVYFGFIKKDSELHSGDSNLHTTATADILGDNTVTPSPEEKTSASEETGYVSENTSVETEALPKPEDNTPKLSDKISQLSIAKTADTIFLAVEGETPATCTFWAFSRNGETWKQVFEVSGLIGKNGINYEQRSEGDYTTPGGVYHMRECFGILDAPENMSVKYTKVSKNHYWDGDRRSPQYNTMVDGSKMHDGWNKSASEHLIEYKESYNYCMNVGFNYDPVVPGSGSAIFLHCTKSGGENTAGCIAIPEDKMVKCLQMATDNTYIVILRDLADLSKAEEINSK